jgi:energy-coupling factor transporter transmembrane protein EcfT
MDTKYTSKLSAIVKARKTIYKLSPLLLVLLGGGLVSNHFVPGAGAFFGVAAFFVFYKRLVVVAHMPCPKCGQPFGTASPIPLGVGTNHCENCGLSLYEDQV